MTKKKNLTLVSPINYWFFITLILFLLLLLSIFFLIKERLFTQQLRVFLEKYKLIINDFSLSNSNLVNSHLKKEADPSSTTKVIYLKPENFSLKQTFNSF